MADASPRALIPHRSIDPRQELPALELEVLERWRERDVFAWSLAQMHARGVLYEGNRVVPYCPRCETTLSSHEVALGYREIVDPSVYLRLPVAGGEEQLLVWTTTPWTLPGNVAVAVSPRATYARARLGEELFVLAEARVGPVLGQDAQVLETFTGEELRERYRAYRAPIFAASDRPPGELPILADAFVTTEDGTGICHLAPAFGEDDYRVAGAAPEVPFHPTQPDTLYNPVRPDGTYDGRVRDRNGRSWEGRFVKDPELTRELIADLSERGLLLKVEEYEHSYPHCWRCGTPLLYYAKLSWYIATSRLRGQLLAANETVSWYPPHAKHGRFGDWLANNVDWALSRERYWGTPLPVWRCGEGHERCVGSRSELESRGGKVPADLHKPFIDEVVFPCEECGGERRRVPEVIDAWWDSGSMPFAQWHAPFEGVEEFTDHFPADYICEALDQTRGWFYSLLAVSVLLYGRTSYRTVLCLGLILDPEGQKMSKSRGNVVIPWDVIERHGADAFRWYYFTAKQPWDGYRFSVDTVGESVRQFMLTLWNTYRVLVLFANANGIDDPRYDGPLEELDRWALSRLQHVAGTAIERVDDYDPTTAGREIAGFVEDLSNWYVRLSRRRFWDGDRAAFWTLWRCLTDVSRLLAPLVPFVSDEIYDNLDGSQPSVHLCDYPEPDASLRDQDLEWDMQVVRDAIELGRAARAQAKVKLRQPLSEAVVVAADRERAAIERLQDIVLQELNVKAVRFVSEADELGRWELKPNYRSLGPRFGKQMPQVAAAVAALDAQSVAARLRAGETVGLSVEGKEHPVGADDVELVMQPLEGYRVVRSGTHAVALNLGVDDELVREGLAREVVHAVQAARKAAGLEVEDRISLVLGGDRELLQAVRAHEDYGAGEALATSVAYRDGAGAGEPIRIGDRELFIGVERA